jgi:GNAT superfamily N-acetyltransferase
MAEEWRRGDYVISTDPSLLDLDAVQGFLRRSYWAAERPLETISRSINGSLNFGLYAKDRRQVGFARVVTDFATFAWLCDVFIDEAHRGRGLGVWLIETVVGHPELDCLRLWMLGTRDAHSLYEKAGFRPVSMPEIWMEKRGLGDGGRC